MLDRPASTISLSSFTLHGGRVLLADGRIEETSLSVDDGRIAAIGGETSFANGIEVGGVLILPGIVDLHGDAFERQLMPRPGVSFDPKLALIDTDLQLLSNGITTAYHGLTWSWEPGLRGAEAARAFVAALDEARPHLLTDTKLHLRHETYNLDAEHEIIDWIEDGRVDLLAFNDHMTHIAEKLDKPERLSQYAGRSGLDASQFLDLFERVKARAGEVEESIMRLAGVALRHGVAMASHDDERPVDRAWFHALGCKLCEFPVDEATAGFAAANQDTVILGAPNVLRGKSHCGRLQAADMAAKKLCDALTSDYYYPSLLQAPFRLFKDGRLGLAEAWALVSANPAKAVGLDDRGVIETGKRADILLVSDKQGQLPLLCGVVTMGRLRKLRDFC